jgi:hypothetical protein
VAGALLYLNMEVALGRRTLAGATASKADTSLILKDIFQSLAVFMPCFTSQLPGGIQVYIVTSFCFTLVQSAALRSEGFRQLVGLPSMLTKPTVGIFTQQMIQLKELEMKARKLRGTGPVLGKGVLMYGWQTSFAGSYRKSSIEGCKNTPNDTGTLPLQPFPIRPFPEREIGLSKVVPSGNPLLLPTGPFIPGVSAPPWQLERQQALFTKMAGDARNSPAEETNREYMPQFEEDAMEKANRGESPRPIQFVDVTASKVPKTLALVNVQRLKRKGKNKRAR